MAILPPDHPERFRLAEEVHARPPEPMDTPSRVAYVAVLIDADDRDRERANLQTLCARFAVPVPAAGSTHFSAQLGPLRFKWERHGEFSGYTFSIGGLGDEAFQETPIGLLPPGWLASVPGQTLFAAHARLMIAAERMPDSGALARCFMGNIVVGAEVGDGAGLAFTDFKVHDDGFARFVLVNRRFTPRQAGRMLQRLFEIEVYRMMALLALPIARRQQPRIVEIERALGVLTDDIARDGGGDEALLQQLTRLAAEVESGLVASQFRFGACRAYDALVRTRIAELRERRIDGTQTIDEFMARRFTPAVATCATVSQRLHDLSERVAQASGLLSTRVDIARERQNQSLLASMDRRAKLQLRLQQTVEGLSVAAIVYYVVGLVAYGAKALKAAGLRVEPDLVAGMAIPLVAALALFVVRKVRRHVTDAESRETSVLH
jgi:uncharacterized membrane-anchored protein